MADVEIPLIKLIYYNNGELFSTNTDKRDKDQIQNYINMYLVPAAMELNNKQDITDPTLLTTAKTIVGAINETYNKIPDISNLQVKLRTPQVDIFSNNELELGQLRLIFNTDFFIDKPGVGLDLYTLPDAINGLAAQLLWINQYSNNTIPLVTTNKTIIGAINEIAGSTVTGYQKKLQVQQLEDPFRQSDIDNGILHFLINSQSGITTVPETGLALEYNYLNGDFSVTKQIVNASIPDLETSNKTLLGAINEQQDNLDVVNDYLSTLQQHLQPALDAKQDKQDNDLLTPSKTVVGGINNLVTLINNVTNIIKPTTGGPDGQSIDYVFTQNFDNYTNLTLVPKGYVDSAINTEMSQVQSAMASTSSEKQDRLVSGTNIKTINNRSVVGSGNMPLTKSDVGLDNVDNTSDTNKPVSSLMQAAINTKQDTLISGTNIKTINSQSLLGNGNIVIDKTFVGLSNVDNTSDINKPISTTVQNALATKANQSDLTSLQTQLNNLTIVQNFTTSNRQVTVAILGIAIALTRGKCSFKKGNNIYNISSTNTALVNTQTFAINDFGTTWRAYLASSSATTLGTNITATINNGTKTLQSVDCVSMSFPNSNTLTLIFRDNTTTPPTITFDISSLS